MTVSENEVRVRFALKVDDGFPPITSEVLIGGVEGPNLFRIDNTPFFVEGVALGDVVLCGGSPPDLQYRRLQKANNNKALSILFIDITYEEELYQYLKEKGCYCEFGEFPEYDMLAVCVFKHIDYNNIKPFLLEAQEAGRISLAELCIL
jgi:hypothetical protein